MIVADIVGADVAAQSLLDAGLKIRGGTRGIVRKQAEFLKNAVIEEAGKRFNITDYDQSIHITQGGWQGDLTDAEVYSSAKQAHRLENGYSGTDSLGRTYHDPPRAHFEPAAQRAESEFYDSLVGLVTAASA